ATAISKRWLDRLRDLLRTSHPVTGVSTGGTSSYIASWYALTTFATPWTLNTGAPAQNTSFGFGRRSHQMLSATTYQRTITVTGTSLKVLYAKGASTGSFKVTVDGGAPQTITTASGGGTVDNGATTVSLG